MFITEKIPNQVELTNFIDTEDPDNMHLLKLVQDIKALTP
jgi:hypothetical protein